MGALMLSIEPLAKHHDRKTFDCGNDDLNRYLQTMANQQLAGVAFVTVEPKTFELTAYYERLGFVKTANPLFMLLSVNNI